MLCRSRFGCIFGTRMKACLLYFLKQQSGRACEHKTNRSPCNQLVLFFLFGLRFESIQTCRVTQQDLNFNQFLWLCFFSWPNFSVRYKISPLLSVALGSLNPTRDNRLRGTKLLFPTWRIGGNEESNEGKGHVHLTSALENTKNRCRKTKLYRRGCMTLKTRGEGIKIPIIL